MNSTMLKIAPRTPARDESYAFLNVAGVVLAVACCRAHPLRALRYE
jgi:hypothetical protein